MHSTTARLACVLLVAGVSRLLLTDISDSYSPPEVTRKTPVQSVVASHPLPEPIDFSPPENAAGWRSLEEMHAAYTEAFVNSEGFGMERILTIETPSFRPLFVNRRPFRVERMELVSLMSDQPVAYQSTFVNATRDTLDIHRRRPLTEFEEMALSEIANGKSFVWQEPQFSDTRGVVRSDRSNIVELPSVFELKRKQCPGTLVAELRASESCVACHQINEGALMGAFVYQLSPTLNPENPLSVAQRTR